MEIVSLLAFGAFFLACFGAALTGAFFSPGAWYEALDKPDWRPPNWAFPVVWTILYVMIAVAGWLIWEAGGWAAAWPALALWVLQLVFNALWSPVFFGMKRPDLAQLVAIAMWAAIAATIWAFWPISETAAWLMAPYLLWVTVANALNLSIWRRNPRAWEITA